MNNYLPGLRCPECGDRVFYTTLDPDKVVCADMGHWIGTEKQCEKVDDEWAAFEKWYQSEEGRFYSAQMNDEEIAFAAWNEGKRRGYIEAERTND